MSTGSYDADTYELELARIRQHQEEAVDARLEVFRALAAAGVLAKRADELVTAMSIE